MLTLHEVQSKQKGVFVQHREMHWAIQRRWWYLAATLAFKFKSGCSAAEQCNSVSDFQLEPSDGKKSRTGISPKPKTGFSKTAISQTYGPQKRVVNILINYLL